MLPSKRNAFARAVKCKFLWLLVSGLFVNALAGAATAPAKSVTIVVSASAHARVKFGEEKLAAALRAYGYAVKITQTQSGAKGETIVIGTLTDPSVKKAIANQHINLKKTPGKEGFILNAANNHILIGGVDNSGALYGCLELIDELKAQHTLPQNISKIDQPQMVMRGACVGVQKPTLLPGRGTYEYPYTPELFPWFYDKALWTRYLDSMVNNRMNSLYLWSGHPFASLVKVKDYPYALEVDEATYQKNVDMYNFLTKEADKRGIWVIQGFYNIIVSKPFADQNHLKTQDRNRHIVPIIADYTRKSIAAFVEKYPNVGLLMTLGEAMEGTGQDDIDWLTKTIIPGVKDGLKALGRTDEPPIIVRAHDTDAPEDMKYAKPLYHNLYTMAKYNGEALTTYTPHGSWADLHRTLSRIGTVQIENVHIMANLEPFRYGSDDFIQKCVQAMHSVYEANGLHVYPQASYWDWPYTADNVPNRELQLDRDWIWYKEWARYAWNSDRDRAAEVNYWANQIAERYGCSQATGKDILEAYEQSGEISPKILRRYGITDGNRQTMTLGMLMAELVNPEKYGLFTLLYTSEGPEGEMLSEYAEKEWNHKPHTGETPVQVADDIVKEGHLAVQSISKASLFVTKDKAEFSRLKNDMYCYDAMANCYAAKARAALWVLRYKYSDNVADLEKAVPEMEISLNYFKELVKFTQTSYLYANSMQTKQRKIPVGGNDGKMKTWIELLPVYQKELDNFKKNIAQLKSPDAIAKKQSHLILVDAPVTLAENTSRYGYTNKKSVFTDTTVAIKNAALELFGVTGIPFSRPAQIKSGTHLTFTTDKPVKVLVGYFSSKDAKYAQEPQLETDASANDLGQADVKIASAVQIEGYPPVNVHTFSFKAGTNTLNLPKGIALVLGIVDDNLPIPTYDAGLSNEGNIKDLRWLFN